MDPNINFAMLFDPLGLRVQRQPDSHHRQQHQFPPQVPECIRGLTPKTLVPFLDRLFDFHKEHACFDQPGFHILHLIENYCWGLRVAFRDWMKDRTTVEEFHDSRGLITSYANIDKAARNRNRIAIWVQSERSSVPYECINHCLECFKFLLRHGLIDIDGYDRNGSSWLHVAIECRNGPCINYLLDNLTGEQINSSTRLFQPSLGTRDNSLPVLISDHRIHHPLVCLAMARNQKGFEKVWRRFRGERIKIPRALLGEKLKRQLCSFVSPAFAEYLRMDGFDIGFTTTRSSKPRHLEEKEHSTRSKMALQRPSVSR